MTEHFILRQLFIILTTNYPHFQKNKPTIKNPLLCCIIQGCHTLCQPSPADKLGVQETCSSRLTVCLRNFHPLTSSGPSSLLQGLSLFSLGQTLPSWSFICLFPPHLSFTRPLLTVLLCCTQLLCPWADQLFSLLCDLGRFFNLSEPVSPLVLFFFFLLTEHLGMCWVLC